jgi:selenide,water dikinase
LLEGALELAAAGLLTSGDKTNREYVGDDVGIGESVDKDLLKLLFDPQTAGGMLIAMSEDKANRLLTQLHENYPQAAIIGQVSKRSRYSIIVN